MSQKIAAMILMMRFSCGEAVGEGAGGLLWRLRDLGLRGLAIGEGLFRDLWRPRLCGGIVTLFRVCLTESGEE